VSSLKGTERDHRERVRASAPPATPAGFRDVNRGVEAPVDPIQFGLTQALQLTNGAVLVVLLGHGHLPWTGCYRAAP
jgi:hypothetical protein